MKKLKGNLYIFPTVIADNGIMDISPRAIEVLHKTKHFIVERARTARRYISKTKPPYSIQEILIEEISEKDTFANQNALKWLYGGHDVGLMSESGMPGVADPGSEIVRFAHINGIKVIPLVGPSSILLSLSASGLNGQNFTFHGYLPIKEQDLSKKLKSLESQIQKSKQTQIFIETPYRNQRILNMLKQKITSNIKLCIAMDITGESEYIKTLSISDWKRETMELKKLPTIFLLG